MGSFKLELSAFPIWNLVDECAGEFKLQAQKKGVGLKLDFSALDERAPEDFTGEDRSLKNTQLPPDLLHRMIVGDRVRIFQVIRNLVSNGLKVSDSSSRSCSFLKAPPHQLLLLSVYSRRR